MISVQGAAEPPRCALEALAKSVFEKHTEGARGTFDPLKSGAEWWVQVRPAFEVGAGTNPVNYFDQSVSFHWDKDEDVVDEQGETLRH